MINKGRYFGNQRSNIKGFTLIEVMLVIALLGVMVTIVQFNFGSNRPEDVLKEQSLKFAGIFEIAAEYSMLNNLELGLVVEKNQYQLLAYDGENWSEIPDNKMFTVFQLPQRVEIVLQLEDLPIEQPQIYDASTFNLEDDDDFTIEDEEEKKVIPQVYILSGGDITPFSLSFKLVENEYFEPEEDITYRVTGLYNTPLKIEGPLIDGRLPEGFSDDY
ncbi:MAG: type II secretion system minor pseudopilin GspH [Alteromonadaceae bacterium]|nr:type II secretion system minor pseudopilin GspH [Alteromonadaceae bacterium]